ncbi:MAG: PhnD/SsuA/transferrin family substrate-binding protein [Candidatus Promineifilaceae bacterium]|jgi:phosphonate transport system substrate-binding protein
MFKNKVHWIILALVVFSLLLAACEAEPVEVTRLVEVAGDVVTRVVTEFEEKEVEVTRVVEQTQEVEVEVTREVMVEEAALGSAERPIKVLFVPSVDVDTIVSGGDVMAEGLKEATGYEFEVSVPTSYAATIEEMCASPDDTMAFIPAQGYVLANDRCGITVGGAAVRYGLSWYAAMIVVPFDSDLETIDDLNGLTWGIPEFGSTSGYLFPSAMFQSAGVEPGEIVDTGGHTNAMLALYNGEVDFATAFFSPPLLPNYARTWQYGIDDPEIWREAGESPVRNEEGRTFVGGDPADGGYRILDARASVNETAPDIFDTTRILALTDQIPNDSVSFSPDFPLNIANQIVASLEEWVSEDNPACMESICNQDFYNWTGVEPVSDSYYDAVRFLMDTLGITEEDVLGG